MSKRKAVTNTERPRWEYKLLSFHNGRWTEDDNEVIFLEGSFGRANQLGEEGWEAISWSETRIVFKRMN